MIGTTTVARALEIVAQRFGLTVQDNREELVNRLNELRSLMYASYQRYEVAVDRKICIPVQSYCLDCDNCAKTYRGITLPYDAAAPESIKIWDSEVLRNSEYKDFTDCGPLRGWDVAGRIPAEKDIECGCSGRLLLKAASKDDKGKKSEIVFLDSNGKERREEMVFGEKDRTRLAASRVLSVSLPNDRQGIVKLSWKNGNADIHLSTYHRSESVPSYTRVRFNLSCAARDVSVIYARQFFEVFDDNEIVETDNIYALKEFASYLSINSRRNNSAGDRQEAEVHRVNAEQAIVGIQRRSDGMSQQHTMNVTMGLSKRSGLYSKR